MAKIRKINKVWQSKPTMEGAGVHLHRAFGYHEVPQFDPFLLLDDFRGDDPADYLKGFPWHPHRGIETITYVLAGEVEHGDSMGNRGVIAPGDVQWMTAGSGIIHQEMPQGDDRGPHVRLSTLGQSPGLPQDDGAPLSGCEAAPRFPRSARPRRQGEDHLRPGQRGRGPVKDIVTDPEYLDVTVPAGAEFHHPIPPRPHGLGLRH